MQSPLNLGSVCVCVYISVSVLLSYSASTWSQFTVGIFNKIVQSLYTYMLSINVNIHKCILLTHMMHKLCVCKRTILAYLKGILHHIVYITGKDNKTLYSRIFLQRLAQKIIVINTTSLQRTMFNAHKMDGIDCKKN